MACSSVFAFADSTTHGYNYYGITLGDGSTPNLTPVNSADMLGYVLSVLSSNQKAIYNKLSNLSGGSSIDYTSLLTSINSNISTGLWTPINTGTDKLFYVGDTLSYINRPGWSNGEGLGQILTAYMSAMSYNIVSVYNELINVKSNTALLSNLPSILTAINDFKSANHTDVTKVDTDINAFKSANHIDISQVDTDLNAFKSANHIDISSFNDDYNNISWSSAGSFIGTYSTYNGSNLINTNGGYVEAYPTISVNPGFSLYNIRIPVTFRNFGYLKEVNNIKAFYLNASNKRIDIPMTVVAYNQQYGYTDLIVYFGQLVSSSFNIRFEINVEDDYVYVYQPTSLNNYVKAINYDEKDFYDVQNFVFNFNINKLLEQAKFMFFDDETIAAKKSNASQTIEVINGFTGSGSASASAGDFGDIKDSVGSVKSGLNTNVSISNILGIFNNNDGYGFWSDATRQELNTTGNNRSNYKTRGVSDTPLYDAKINELYKAMGVKYE